MGYPRKAAVLVIRVSKLLCLLCVDNMMMVSGFAEWGFLSVLARLVSLKTHSELNVPGPWLLIKGLLSTACFSVCHSALGPGAHPTSKRCWPLLLPPSSTDLPLPGEAERFPAKPEAFLLPAPSAAVLLSLVQPSRTCRANNCWTRERAAPDKEGCAGSGSGALKGVGRAGPAASRGTIPLFAGVLLCLRTGHPCVGSSVKEEG